MPCPAKKLGFVEPCIAIENSKANTGSGGWHAEGSFGHGMPCPYLGKNNDVNQERGRGGAKHQRSRCVFALAQAGMPVLLKCGLRSGEFD